MFSTPNIPRTLLVLLLIALGGGLLLSMYMDLPLELPLLATVGLGLLCYVGMRSPEWFIVGALFAPQWKTFWIFKSIDQRMDLTGAMLLCLAAALLWRVLVQFGRSNSMDFRTIFFGQQHQLLAYLIFAVIVSASFFYTTAPDYGASKLNRFLVIGTLLLISPFFIILTEENFRRFARIFVGFSAFTAIQLITSLETRNQQENVDITRIGAGWLLGMGVLLVLFYPLIRNRRWQRALYLFVLPLLIVGLMASAARGPIVSLSVVILAGLFVWLRQGRLRGRSALVLLLLFVAGFGGAYLLLRQTDLGKYNAKAKEFGTLLSEGASSGSAGKRLDFYQTTVVAIPNHLLFGAGVGSWSTFYFGIDDRGYPHDLPLEIAFEEGLLGLAAFAVLLGFVAVSIVRMLRASRFHFLALGLIVAYCVLVSLFSGDLDDNRLLWLWIGVALAMCRTIQLHVPNGHLVRRAFRKPFTVAAPAPLEPAFTGRLSRQQHPVSRKGRAWREKFV